MRSALTEYRGECISWVAPHLARSQQRVRRACPDGWHGRGRAACHLERARMWPLKRTFTELRGESVTHSMECTAQHDSLARSRCPMILGMDGGSLITIAWCHAKHATLCLDMPPDLVLDGTRSLPRLVTEPGR